MKFTNVLWYIVGLLGPVILFIGIIPLGNEKYPLAVWPVCIILMALAGYMTSRGYEKKSQLKWIGWSVFIGVIEAAALVFLV